MKFILVLLFCATTFAQIQVVGDTTSLKLTTGSGVVLLLQYKSDPAAGGGFFKRVDSAYVEDGANAFDHPYSGSQWLRIQQIGGNYFFNSLQANTFSLASSCFALFWMLKSVESFADVKFSCDVILACSISLCDSN